MTLDDNTGIDALIKSALPSLWRFALQITRDNHDAEDLVHNKKSTSKRQIHGSNLTMSLRPSKRYQKHSAW